MPESVHPSQYIRVRISESVNLFLSGRAWIRPPRPVAATAVRPCSPRGTWKPSSPGATPPHTTTAAAAAAAAVHRPPQDPLLRPFSVPVSVCPLSLSAHKQPPPPPPTCHAVLVRHRRELLPRHTQWLSPSIPRHPSPRNSFPSLRLGWEAWRLGWEAWRLGWAAWRRAVVLGSRCSVWRLRCKTLRQAGNTQHQLTRGVGGCGGVGDGGVGWVGGGGIAGGFRMGAGGRRAAGGASGRGGAGSGRRWPSLRGARPSRAGVIRV